jgi:hypothetical protein
MRINRAGNRLQTVILLAVTVLVSGSQCARVDDRAFGPDMSAEARNAELKACIKDCQDAAQEARMAEQERFVEAIRDCGPDENGDCQQSETALHRANLEQIQADEEFCKATNCHDQGNGQGGQ